MNPRPLLDEFAPDLPRPAVLCAIVKIAGSAPQDVGARMWVTASEFFGTLGGGRLELEVLEHARALLRSPEKPHLRDYVLCKEMGQCCGGRVSVFFELRARRKEAHLFGAGHVGRAVAEVLSGTPLAVTMIDPRAEWTRRADLPPDVRIVRGEPLEYARARAWSADDAACVFTHSHDLDFALLELLLPRPLGYLGLIGSEHKAEVFKARLASGRGEAVLHDRSPRRDQHAGGRGGQGAADLEELWEAKVRCPMGEALPSKNPKVIAVSIASQLLKTWGLGAPHADPAENPQSEAPREP